MILSLVVPPFEVTESADEMSDGNGACNKISACSESDARIIVPFVWFDQPSGHHEGDDDVADTTLSTEFDLLTVMLLLGMLKSRTP